MSENSPKTFPHQQDEVLRNDGDLAAVFSLFQYGRGTYHLLAFSILLIVAASAMLMCSARILGALVEALLGDTPLTRIMIMIGAILTLETLQVMLTYCGRVSLSFVTNKIAFRIRLTLFAKITTLPIAYFDRQPLGRTITRLTNDVEGIEAFFGSTLSRVFAAAITLLSIIVAMFATNPLVGSVVTLAALPAMLLTLVARGPIRRWNRLYKVRSARLNAKLAEYINGILVIKVFGLENWSYRKYVETSRELFDAGIGLVTVNSLVRPTINLLCFLPIMVILWWGGLKVLDGTLALGVLVAFVRYAERFLRPVMALSNEIHVMQEAITSSERVQKMLDEPEERDALGPSGDYTEKIAGNVSFNDIWMEYNVGRPILKGISFDARKGMKIGLVGETGSGKTTTLNLLPQLYPTMRGAITIDGRPLATWDRQVVRGQIGLVSQDIVIFRGSLRENLLWSKDAPEIPMDDAVLMDYCSKTGLDVVMHRMNSGLDTLIIDGGENLSVGERQLIAFTRMLVRDPALLILDEATANIDEKYEGLIQKAIREVLRERTCFVIAHRLGTILQCDEILVFDDGRIVERGTHDELMAMQGYYSRLAAKQRAALC